MGSRIARVLGLSLFLAAGVSCNSSTISGKGTGGCATTCSTSDAVCGAVGCNGAGACVYPDAGTGCPGTICSDGVVSGMVCDGAGACRPDIGTACPGNRGCTADGGCRISCATATDCASGFVCNAGACVSPIAAGSCTADDDCISGICGNSSTGNCCSKPCRSTDPVCASTGCDESGACLYPDQTVLCGPGQSCTGSTQTNAASCDGLGNCGASVVDCAPFGCGSDACGTTCASGNDCATGALCDVASRICCGGLADAGVLAVDSVLGDDAVACCGFGDAMPCRTLSHAMSLVGAGPPSSTIIRATVNGAASGDWSPGEEVYPIELGWGVELSAPGIFFSGPDAGLSFVPAAIFELSADAGGAESASIVGTEVNPVRIGMDQAGDQLLASDAILDGQGSTLYLANANVNGSVSNTAIYANGSTLVLGQDRSGAVVGPVQIGNDLANPQPIGGTGIDCNACVLSDVPTSGGSTLVIFGQTYADLLSSGASAISLTSAPILGIAPTSLGFNTCPSKPDQNGMLLYGTMTLTLDQATIQCMSSAGINVDDDGSGGMPSVTINQTTIQNTHYALLDTAGSVAVSKSVIRYNTLGVAQGDEVFRNGSIDLSGGLAGGRNTVACSSGIESGAGYSGVSVWNSGINALNASNVDWDTPGPDSFGCDFNLANCSCQIGDCIVAPGADGMDAVVSSSGVLSTNGHALSPLNCASATPSP